MMSAIYHFINLWPSYLGPPSSELEYHNQLTARVEVIVAYFHLICELLPSEDQSDLGDLDTLTLLECGLHIEDGIVRLEVEGLLLSCQGLYDQLHD